MDQDKIKKGFEKAKLFGETATKRAEEVKAIYDLGKKAEKAVNDVQEKVKLAPGELSKKRTFNHDRFTVCVHRDNENIFVTVSEKDKERASVTIPTGPVDQHLERVKSEIKTLTRKMVKQAVQGASKKYKK